MLVKENNGTKMISRAVPTTSPVSPIFTWYFDDFENYEM